ncbi:replication initiation protein [Clostridium sp.]|uniref:replication initiation protein n=1 Tax=Clostridium sp. TaxID=1506 RepID=UPI0028FE27C5|nr:replication initiation protein [Clostridium sp.]MDU2155266.1 replication initiation protein [Clostridium sp.]
MKTNQEKEIHKMSMLVQNTINKLTLHQNRILCVLLGTKRSHSDITIKELLDLLHLSDGGDNYKMIREQTEDFFANCLVTFTDGSKHIGLMYFENFIYDEDTNIISFKWSESIKPYLTELNDCFTKYLQGNFLLLKSKRSQILYKLMKSYQSQQFITISVEDLKKKLNANKPTYQDFRHFNNLIIKKCIKEINEVTDLLVTMKTIKRGKYVVALKFTIQEKIDNSKKQEIKE